MELVTTAEPKATLKKRLRSKKTLALWTVIFLLAMSAAAFFFVVSPQWQRVGAGRELDVAAEQQNIDARQKYLDQLKTLRVNYTAIAQADVELVSRVLPTNRALPELLQQMEAIGRESGVEISSVNVADVAETRSTARQQLQAEVAGGAQKQDGALKQMTVQLQVSTNRYDRFKQLLNALQSNARIIDVESYLFSADQDVQTVTAKAYYLPL